MTNNDAQLPRLSLTERAWRKTRHLWRRHRHAIGLGLVSVVFLGIVTVTWVCYWKGIGSLLLKDALELTAIATALPALAGLFHQTRSSSYWNSVRSYHDYFDELPVPDKVSKLYDLLDACELTIPSLWKALSADEIKRLKECKKLPKSGCDVDGVQVIAEYLNDYEEFAGAVTEGVVDADYAYKLEGTRVIVAYYGFRAFIEAQRAEQNDTLRGNLNGVSVDFLRSRAYILLENLAKDWFRRRTDDDWDLSAADRAAVYKRVVG